MVAGQPVVSPVEMVEFRDPKMVDFLCWHDSLIVSRKSDPAIKVHYSLFKWFKNNLRI